MSRSAYYESLKVLAREVRVAYALRSYRVLRSDMRRIYRDQAIRLDLWPYRCRQLRGAYFNDECGPTVLLAKDLPDEPAIFTLGHELKHHLVDKSQHAYYCADSNVNEVLEIGAEVFGAELIFPEGEYASVLSDMGVRPENFRASHLVHLKRETSTTLSYAGLAKRAEFLGFAPRGSLGAIKWKKLEEALYGEPEYRRIQRYRAMRATRLR